MKELTSKELWYYLWRFPEYSLSSVRRTLQTILKNGEKFDVDIVSRYLNTGIQGGLGYGNRIHRIFFNRAIDGVFWSQNPKSEENNRPRYEISKSDNRWHAVFSVPGATCEENGTTTSLGRHKTIQNAKLACSRHAEVQAAVEEGEDISYEVQQ